jgi:phosphonate transport system permease protein
MDGEKKGRYPTGSTPDWVQIDRDRLHVELRDGHVVDVIGKTVLYEMPGYGMIEVEPSTRGVQLRLPTPEVPNFISASSTRVTISTPAGRVAVTKSKTQIFRNFFGWELFFFTLDSPFHGKTFGELLNLAVSTDRVVDEHSNIGAMFDGFWNNSMWLHKQVAWAMFETFLMAFLGTIGAAIIALPLAFVSAKNFTPSWLARFSLRRVFDFLRGVDGLIWTIVLSRAFGPGPLTGALAILLTDTGTFGKMFSESLENVDEKQIEGVRSTGAKPLQRYRFGVIPQITPVFLSQVLYYLESNTRSATVIGAIVGGGIGLLLTQAIITGKDWEEVTYYIILVILMVMLMDTLSGWLRRKLIGNEKA